MPEHHELIGGRYRLGPAIGVGGMGTVRRARDLRFDRDVAVKLLHTTGDPRHEERMRREARLLGGLQHPNLVVAFDTGIDLSEAGPMHWLAMELVRGPDLGVLLRRAGRLESEVVRRIVHDSAAALTALHAAGVVHRDLKPANVLLTAEPGPRPWHAKLADLGIARTDDAAGMTTTGQVMGTAAYLSPEQVSGLEVDPASDVYSLGLLALEALTGEHAFAGNAVESATARLVRPPEIPDWIAGGWRMLLEAMTAIDPPHRPSAAQVLAATADPLPALVPATPLPAEVWDEGEPTAAAVPLDATAVLPVPSALLDPTEEVAVLRPVRRRAITPIAAAIAVVIGVGGGGAVLLAAHGPEASPVPSHSVLAAPAPTAVPTAAPKPTTVAATTMHTTAPAPRPSAAPQHSAVTRAVAAPAPAKDPPKRKWKGSGWGSGDGHGHGHGHGRGHD